MASVVWPRSVASVARRNRTREGGGATLEGLRGWDTVSGERASTEVVGRLGEETARQVFDAASTLRACVKVARGKRTRTREHFVATKHR
jgi:hypothetical protein